MEVWKEIKRMFLWGIVVYFMLTTGINYLNIGVDDTDLNGQNRSGVTLITDHGTGMQYLYRGGALIPRVDRDGKHVHVGDKE